MLLEEIFFSMIEWSVPDGPVTPCAETYRTGK